jgi:hypothetical protein
MKKNIILITGAFLVAVTLLMSCEKRQCWTCTTLVTDREYAGNVPTHIIHRNDTIMCGRPKADVMSYEAAHTYTLTGSDGKPNYIEYTDCR